MISEEYICYAATVGRSIIDLIENKWIETFTTRM